MADVSATEAARRFAALLDAVEQRGERFTVVRRGKAVAHIEPVSRGRGADVKAVLRRHATDGQWPRQLSETRDLLIAEERP